MSDEQRVRTMAGWIGVEISRSRVRTSGKAGYGLYRVRVAAERHWHVPHPKVGPDGPWTAYAFGLNVIEAAVQNSIQQGRPAAPMALHLVEDGTAVKTGAGGYAAGHVVPVRWTSAYRGRRNLGELDEGGHVVDAALGGLDETVREIATKPTVRSRQRVDNAAFQAEHLRRREWGLQQRHARKTSRNSIRRNGQSPMP